MQHASTSQTEGFFDPYAPPGVTELGGTGSAISGPLYSVNHVSKHPARRATLMAINEHRLGRARAVGPTMRCGLVASAVLLALAFALPASFPSAPLGIGSLLAVRAMAQSRQGALVQARMVDGAKRGSSWFAFGVGLASTLVVVVPVLAIVFASSLLGG